MSLHLVVALDSLRIGGRMAVAAASLSWPGIIARDTGWNSVCCAVASLGLRRRVGLARHVVIGGRSTAAFYVVALERFVSMVFGVRVFKNDVPGVQQARKIAQDAEGDVDDGVGGAYADLDPHCSGSSRVSKKLTSSLIIER
jgi:hypothetical protein